MQVSTLKFRHASVAVVGAVALAVAAPALAHQSAAPKTVGNATAGKALFSSTCGTCHTLKAAGTAGTLGPNLNKITKLTEAKIIQQIDNGGSGVIGKAAASKYSTTMIGYKSTLSTTQIDNIAAFVFKYQG